MWDSRTWPCPHAACCYALTSLPQLLGLPALAMQLGLALTLLLGAVLALTVQAKAWQADSSNSWGHAAAASQEAESQTVTKTEADTEAHHTSERNSQLSWLSLLPRAAPLPLPLAIELPPGSCKCEAQTVQ